MLRKKRPLIVWVLTLLFLLSSAGIAGAAPVDQAQQTGATPFTDVNSTDKNAVYINYMAKRGLISGFPDGTYHPGEGLTRAQAAVLFCKIRGLNPTEKNSTFNDVVGNHWAAAYIAAAVKAGYITGFPDGTYRPQATLTRAQGINLFLQLATEKDSSEEPRVLQDLEKNHWAANSIAIALAAGMIEAQGNSIKPEQPFARGDLARALSILLTKDPGLSQQELIGKLQVKNGTVEIKRAGSEKEQTINTASIVRKGDTVITGKDGQAEINYPDGSGILLKPDSELIIKTSIGRAYIVKDGRPGTTVEDLQVELTNGKLFGALASKYTGKEETEENAKETAANNKYNKIASRDKNFDLIAAKTSAQPWYKTAEKKKVKIKVDMPWGVAAIRGSFWSNYTSNSGSGMSLLQGDGSLSSGGQTQNLSPGQSSGSGSGQPPSPPGPMSPSEARDWAQQRGWVGERASDMQSNQGAGDPGSEGEGQGEGEGEGDADTLDKALDQAAQTAASAPSGSSGGGSSSTPSTPSTPVIGSVLGSWSLQNVAVVNVDDQSTVLTQEFGVSPAAGLTADEYELLVKSGSYYNPISERIPVTQKVRYLAKLFEQPENLAVKFYQQGRSYSIGIARLNGNILENLANKTISGTISLESGVAPAGGITANIYVTGEYSYEFGNFRQQVTIPAGASSAPYTISVPDNRDAQNAYQVRYSLSGTYSEPYLHQGEYPNRVSVIDGNQANINLTIGLGQVVSGKVVLPAANTSGRKINISISASGNRESYGTGVSLDPGQQEATYSLVAAPDDYRLSYYINDDRFCADNRYMRRGYYKSITETVGEYNQASTVSVGTQAVNGIDLNIIPGGYYISGTISLPNAPGRNVEVYVGAQVIDNYDTSIYYTVVTIPADQSSATYIIWVYEYSQKNYKVGYSIRDGSFCKDKNCICAGYYNSVGMVNTPGEAEVCSVDSSGRDNINLAVIGGGALISGSLSMPSGQVAPSGGLDVTIHATDGSCGARYSTNVIIPAGQTWVPYYLVVPGNEASYEFSAELPGYYNANQSNLATLQFSSIDTTQNLTLQPVSQSGAGGGGGSGGISPDAIANHSVLVCGKAFNINSSEYNSTNIAAVAGTCGLYYKSALANTAAMWFDLLNPAAVSEAYLNNPSNAVSPLVLGTIYDYSGGVYFDLGGGDIVVPVGWTHTRTCQVTPTDATLDIIIAPDSIAECSIVPTTGDYPIINVRGIAPGTTAVFLRASKDGLTYDKTISIRVIPLLTINPVSLAQGYADTSMTVSETVYSGSVWNVGDSVQLQLVRGNSAIPVTNVAIPSSVTAEDNSFAFTLPAGLEQGEYGLVVSNLIDGVATPIGVAIFAVNADNPAYITGAEYNAGTGLLTINTSGVLSGSTFDPTKLIYRSDTGGEYAISAGVVESSSYNPDSDPVCGRWQVQLKAEAKEDINTLAQGQGQAIYLYAYQGWNVFYNIEAVADFDNLVTVVFP